MVHMTDGSFYSIGTIVRYIVPSFIIQTAQTYIFWCYDILKMEKRKQVSYVNIGNTSS